MKVLTHAWRLERLGGVETSTAQWTRSLVDRGHDVSVLFEVDGAMRTELAGSGVRLQGGARFAFAPRTAPADLLRMLPSAAWAARHRPDVLWLQRFEHVVWGQVVARAARRPVVAHLHHMPNYRRVALLGAGIHRYLAVSEFMREQWVAAGLPAHRVLTVPNAVPEEDYPHGGPAERRAARTALGLPQDVFLVLHYGRLGAAKGLDVLLDAWELAAMPSDEAHLLLVGDVDGAAAAERIDSFVQEGAVTHVPVQDDVTTALHAADLVVFPSLLAESFGRVVLEGMLTGRRVLASRTGAVPEILREEFARDLLAPGDVRALAAALRSAASDEGAPDLGQRAAQWARERYPYARFVDRVESALAEAARS